MLLTLTTTHRPATDLGFLLMKNPGQRPRYALVLLIGASGTGKSSFAEKHFLPTEVISSGL